MRLFKRKDLMERFDSDQVSTIPHIFKRGSGQEQNDPRIQPITLWVSYYKKEELNHIVIMSVQEKDKKKAVATFHNIMELSSPFFYRVVLQDTNKKLITVGIPGGIYTTWNGKLAEETE